MNLVDNDTDDTVAFNAKTRWYFNKERSGKLTGDELVTIPHPLIMVGFILYLSTIMF